MGNSLIDFKFPHEGNWICLGNTKTLRKPEQNANVQERVFFISENYFKRGNDFQHAFKKNEIIFFDIGIKLLPLVIPGTVFSYTGEIIQENVQTAAKANKDENTNTYLGISNVGTRKILLNNHGTINPQSLESILSKSFLENSSFKFFQGIQCISVPDENNKETYIFPCSEIARFFLFTGSSLCDSLIGTVQSKDPLNDLEINFLMEQRDLYLETKQGYSELELITLGRIAISPRTQYVIKGMLSFLQNGFARPSKADPQTRANDAYLSLQFPFASSSNMIISGIPLAVSGRNYFLVFQIHETDEKLSFDRIKWTPTIDTSQWKDKKGHGKLPFSGVPTLSFRTNNKSPKDDRKITSLESGDKGSFTESINIKNGSLGLLNNKTLPEVIRIEKKDQENRHLSKCFITETYNNTITTGKQGSGKSGTSSGKLDVDVDEGNKVEKPRNWLEFEYIHGVTDELKHLYYSCFYYNGIKKCFQEQQFIVKRAKYRFCVVELIRNDRHLYLFEVIYDSNLHPTFTALYYNAGMFKYTHIQIEELIKFCIDNDSTWKTKSFHDKAYNTQLRKFNHQNEPFKESAKKINDVIAKLINKKAVLS